MRPDSVGSDSWRIVVRLLDGFELVCKGEVVSIPPGCQRVLALLALHERPLPRPFVVGTLWPETPETCAQASLRADLHRLHACPARLVDATRTHLALSDDVAVDVHAQLTAMASVEAMTAESPSAELIGLLTGDLLPGWYDDWLLIERELLRSRRLHALETLARRWGREGRYASAIEACLTVLASDPLRETAQSSPRRS